MNLEIASAKIAHLDWKIKLTDFMYGLNELNKSDIVNHFGCKFGKWFYSSGMEEFGHLPIMTEVEVLHKEVHDDITRMTSLSAEQRKSDEGEKQLQAFYIKCDQLVGLLDRLEREVG